jgi:Flp pilus assembly protein TadG
MRTARESYAGMMRKLAEKKIAAIRSDQRGVSALEFAIFVGILAFGLLNTADISI